MELIFSTIVVSFVGSIIAAFVSSFCTVFLSAKWGVKATRTGLFKSLMATRTEFESLEHRTALEHVRIEFTESNKNNELINSLNEYVRELTEQSENNENSEDRKLKLLVSQGKFLFQLGKSVDQKVDQIDMLEEDADLKPK